MSFLFAPEEDWLLEPTIVGTRRDALWTTAYDEIVDKLVKGMSIQFVRRAESSKCRVGFKRLSLHLSADPQVIDLFHNGRGGYRAQYFHSVANGEEANRYAFKKVINRVGEITQGKLGRSRAKVFAGALEYGGKLWIKEGQWCRAARKELIVPLWREGRPVKGVKVADAKRKIRYGAAAPECETRFVLKGEWIDESGKPPKIPLKEGRSHSIRFYGFT